MQEQHLPVMCDQEIQCRRSGHYCREQIILYFYGAAGCWQRWTAPKCNGGSLWTSCQKEKQITECNPAHMAARSADGSIFDSVQHPGKLRPHELLCFFQGDDRAFLCNCHRNVLGMAQRVIAVMPVASSEAQPGLELATWCLSLALAYILMS